MMNRWKEAVILIVACAGCAGAPSRGSDEALITNHIQLSAQGMEYDQPATLPSEPALAGPHPVDYYVQIALERNPEILAAQRGVAAQAEVIPQVTALDDPMLVETFQPIDDNSVQTAAGRGPSNLMLSQRFPWFGKLRLRGEVAEQETRIALSRLAQAQLKVIEDVHLAYYEVYFSQRAIEITERDRELLEDLLKIAEARYRTRATSQQDVLRAQVELNRVDDRLIALNRQLRVAQADLAKVLHTSPEAEPSAQSDLAIPSAPEQIDRLYEWAIRCRPELQERLAAIVRDQRIEELARRQYYPDITAGIGWQAITTDEAISPVANGHDNLAFTVGVNLPIWRDKLRAGVREAEHRIVQSARRYDAERDDTFRLIRRLMIDIRALEQQIELFRDSIIPKADQTLRVSMADYRVGKVDFLQLIDNWLQLLAFEVQLARFEASLGQRLASLERVVGCQLAGNGSGTGRPEELPPPEPVEPAEEPKSPPKGEDR